MKQKIIVVLCLCLVATAKAQVAPNGALPAANTAARANAAWYRGGNTNDINNNIFGTLWNSPIYTQTSGLNRSKLNGNFIAPTQYFINGYGFGNTQQTLNTSGYMLIGVDKTSVKEEVKIYKRVSYFFNKALGSTLKQSASFKRFLNVILTLPFSSSRIYFSPVPISNANCVLDNPWFSRSFVMRNPNSISSLCKSVNSTHQKWSSHIINYGYKYPIIDILLDLLQYILM